MNFFSRFMNEPVQDIQVSELHKKLSSGKGPYLLDVRQPEEFRVGHIPGAKLIPLGELSKRLDEVPQGVDVVCICASGHRSVPAVRQLTTAGITVSSLKDGMIAWQMAKLPVIKGIAG
jgi:rhodanese-related sulfurtransferase